MNEVLNLLNEKNQHLEKFFHLNECELLNFSEGNFDNLENFYNSREGILNIVQKIDDLINQVENTPTGVIENSIKKRLMDSIDYKNDLVTKILSQDLQILSCIEKAKSEIIKELTQVKAGRKAIGAYKSGINSRSIDEKA